MELLQRTARRPFKLSKSTPARLVTIMTAPSMRSYGRRMRNCLAAKERKATMKYGQGHVTKTSKNNTASKAWIPSANVLPLQEPGRQLLEAMAMQQRLSRIHNFRLTCQTVPEVYPQRLQSKPSKESDYD